MESELEAGGTKAKRRRRGEVTLFDNWCKGCGLCIAFCPTTVFDTDPEGHPVVARQADCIACQWCVVHCPDFAIHVAELDGSDGDRQAEEGA